MGYGLGTEFKDFLRNFFTEVQYTYNAHIVSVGLNEFLQTVYSCSQHPDRETEHYRSDSTPEILFVSLSFVV